MAGLSAFHGMSARVSILLVVVCIAFGCSKPQQTISRQTVTDGSPLVPPPDARLTIAEVSQIATKAALAAGYLLDDYTQGPPHFVRITDKLDKISWQVDFPRRNPMPGGRDNPTNYFMVLVGDNSGRSAVRELLER